MPFPPLSQWRVRARYLSSNPLPEEERAFVQSVDASSPFVQRRCRFITRWRTRESFPLPFGGGGVAKRRGRGHARGLGRRTTRKPIPDTLLQSHRVQVFEQTLAQI